jgi:hypothetical protein
MFSYIHIGATGAYIEILSSIVFPYCRQDAYDFNFHIVLSILVEKKVPRNNDWYGHVFRCKVHKNNIIFIDTFR